MPTDDISKWLKLAIVAGVLAIYIAVTVGIFTWQIPGENRDIAYAMVGGLTALLTTIVNYFFGSSHASRGKDDTIATLAGK